MHRTDIDGLRAIAVLSVVLFHLGVSSHLSGGFVGVDVFFVISGYLITGILQEEIDRGGFSLTEFYHRRVRRIFPALFVVHVCTLLGSAVILFPSETKDTAREVLWSLAFLSNVVFERAGGYFDQAAKSSALLHTWSLSVEEQFYIGLPLLLAALSRARPWQRRGVLLALAVLSFVLSQRMVHVDARRAFYLVQYRAWELLGGSLLALGAVPQTRNRIALEGVGLAGIAAIVWSVVTIRGDTPFPGAWAVPPCAGTLACLYAGRDRETIGKRLLGMPPLRWVGLISYSLYLWHWPVIALFNARNDQMTPRDQAWIFGLTLAVSIVSYRYIERPFRRKPYQVGARGALRVAAIGMAAVSVLSVVIPAAAARLRPSSVLADEVIGYTKYGIDLHSGTCFLNSGFDDVDLFRKDLCLKLDPKRKNYLIMGDSHAANFAPAISAMHPEINLLQATASGCQPARKDSGAKRCTKLFAYVFDEFLPTHRVDTLILAGRWPKASLPALRRTVAYVRPFADRVVVLGPIVEYDQSFPQLLARSITENDPGLPARHLLPHQAAIDRAYAGQLDGSGAEYFSIYDAICPKDECTLWASPGVPMQHDQHHLTLRGSQLVLTRLGPSLFR